MVSVLVGSSPAVSTSLPVPTLESDSGVGSASAHGLVQPPSPSPDPLFLMLPTVALDQSTLLDVPILISLESDNAASEKASTTRRRSMSPLTPGAEPENLHEAYVLGPPSEPLAHPRAPLLGPIPGGKIVVMAKDDNMVNIPENLNISDYVIKYQEEADTGILLHV
ncbi:hypothetical protein NDU88_003381 [Pleurodeles waltl]|uniref:Uncharacterized protein n=1 Tax=Pleurodeles waltl TaxID=8319 RepID=A0AAV7SF28_PLEWA|nr:hypothetical protein NDU88_003381 [Pleurodeles waltl]